MKIIKSKERLGNYTVNDLDNDIIFSEKVSKKYRRFRKDIFNLESKNYCLKYKNKEINRYLKKYHKTNELRYFVHIINLLLKLDVVVLENIDLNPYVIDNKEDRTKSLVIYTDTSCIKDEDIKSEYYYVKVPFLIISKLFKTEFKDLSGVYINNTKLFIPNKMLQNTHKLLEFNLKKFLKH